eukprot:15451479-Alexandrium_andersonii.AAC.1
MALVHRAGVLDRDGTRRAGTGAGFLCSSGAPPRGVSRASLTQPLRGALGVAAAYERRPVVLFLLSPCGASWLRSGRPTDTAPPRYAAHVHRRRTLLPAGPRSEAVATGHCAVQRGACQWGCCAGSSADTRLSAGLWPASRAAPAAFEVCRRCARSGTAARRHTGCARAAVGARQW